MLAFWSRVSGRRAARRRAEADAVSACEALRADTPIMGATLVAEEPERFVVRVFVGVRDDAPPKMLPPWAECLVFAIRKDALAERSSPDAESADAYREAAPGDRVTLLSDADGSAYQPTLR